MKASTAFILALVSDFFSFIVPLFIEKRDTWTEHYDLKQLANGTSNLTLSHELVRKSVSEQADE